VGVDASGRVAFKATTLRPRQGRLLVSAGGSVTLLPGTVPRRSKNFAPRLTAAGQVIWTAGEVFVHNGAGVTRVVSRSDATPIGRAASAGGADLNDHGDVSFAATDEALYLVQRNRLARAVLRAGEEIPSVGIIEGFGAYALHRGTLIFSATVGGNALLAVAGEKGPKKLVAIGDPTPIGGVLSGLSGFDSSGDAVLFSAAVTGGVADAGIFRTSARSGQTRAVVKTGDPTPAGGAFSEFLGAPVAVEGGGAVFAAVVDDVYAGIFRTERRGPVELLRIGNAAPGTAGRTVSSFRILTASGRSVLFAAELADGEMRSSSILRGFGDRVVTVAPEDAPVRGGGTLGAFFTDESIPL